MTDTMDTLGDARYKLSPGDKFEVLRRYQSGQSLVEIAEHYNVHVRTIKRTLEGGANKKAAEMTMGNVETMLPYIPRQDLPKMSVRPITDEERKDGAKAEYVSQATRLLNMSHDLITGATIAASNAKKLHALAQLRIERIEQQLMCEGGGDSVRCFVSAEDDEAVKLMRPIMAAITAANAAAQAGTDLLRLNIDAVRSSEQALSGGAGNEIPRVEIVFKSPRPKE